MLVLKVFLVFFKIGLFAIGGAYSFLPLLQRDLVDNYHWLSQQEFLDVLGIVKIFPGAISVKYATYVGYKIGGIAGAVAANLGNILAPVILIFFAASLYSKYRNIEGVKGAFGLVQLVVFSMIIAVAFQAVDVSQLAQLKNILLVIISFILFLHARIHPSLIIIGAGILGFFINR